MLREFNEELSRNALRQSRRKAVPYEGLGEPREDGDANYGFKNLKANRSLVFDVPELQHDPALFAVVDAINTEETGLFSIGCVSAAVAEHAGVRRTGYVEFAINSITVASDAGRYFPIFFHFDHLLHQIAFTGSVAFDWELQPAEFVDAGCSGFTCTVFVNTGYGKTKQDADTSWAMALAVLGKYLASIPPQYHDRIY